jgi:hypothetical protein
MKQHQATFKTLIAAGINQLHAAAICKSISEVISHEIADIKITHNEIKQISKQMTSLTNEIEKMELRMIIKLGSIAAVCSSLLFTSIKLWT